jgi:hypothetical protein
MAHLDLSDPRSPLIGNGRDETVHLAVEFEVLCDLAADRLHGTAVVVQLNLGHPGDESVGYPGGQPTTPERILTRKTPATHQIEPFLELVKQWGDIPGVVLPITIHGHNHLASGIREACRNRRSLSEIAFEAEHLNPWLVLVETGEDGIGPVCAAVVHYDELKIPPQGLKHRAHLLDQRLQALLLVINGHNNG